MYWIRESWLLFLPWLVVSGTWVFGGYLIVRHAFHLEDREQPLIGAGLGLILYLWLVNIIGRWMSPTIAFSAAAVVVLLIGIAFASRKRTERFLDWQSIRSSVPGALLFLFFVLFYTRIGKGLGIFDEHKNLSLISTIAAGNLPVRNFYQPSDLLEYHYGFQILGASLVRLGGFFPWSAFDFSKSLIWATNLFLIYTLSGRFLKNNGAKIVTSGVFLFTSGTRFLLLFLPITTLENLNDHITLLGTSASKTSLLSKALVNGWSIDGGPPFELPFAFLNGIKSSYVFAHAGPALLSVTILGVVWMLAGRSATRFSWIILAIPLAFWALTWETSYVLFLIGAGLVTILLWKNKQRSSDFKPVFLGSITSILFAITQGGTLTIWVSNLVRKSTAGAIAAGGKHAGIGGFTLRWPPAIMSAHLGEMHLNVPLELLAGICELGLVVLFLPWITSWAWKRFKRGDWMTGILLTSAWAGFLIPVFVRFRLERDITQFTAYALDIWILLLAWMVWEKWNTPVIKHAAIVSLGIMVMGGVVIGGIQLTAAAQPMLGYNITGLDARISRDLWDKLPQNERIFDPAIWRATALTGRFTNAGNWLNELSPEWERLEAGPTVDALLPAGFRYVYVDGEWWHSLPEANRADLSDQCVYIISEYWDPEGVQFRRMLDIGGCAPSP